MSARVAVPTCAELALQGLAVEKPSKRGTAFVISAEGQRLIYAAMKHNAAVGQLEDEERIAETARQQYIWEMINGPRPSASDNEHDDWRRAEREGASHV